LSLLRSNGRASASSFASSVALLTSINAARLSCR